VNRTDTEARPKPRGFNDRTGRCRHSMREPNCIDCWPPPAPPAPPARCERCGSVKDCEEHTPEVCDGGHALLEAIAKAAREAERERPAVGVPKRALKLRDPQPAPRASAGERAAGKAAAKTAKPTKLRSATELLTLANAGRLRGTSGEPLNGEAIALLERAAQAEPPPPPPDAPSDWQTRCVEQREPPARELPDVGPPPGRRGPKAPHLPLCPYCAALPPDAVLVQFCLHDKNRAKARLRGRKVDHTDAAVLAELRRCVAPAAPGDGEPSAKETSALPNKRSLAVLLNPATVSHLDRLIGTGLGDTRNAVIEQLLTFALSALVFTGAGISRMTGGAL
jgi:hypothetical protein